MAGGAFTNRRQIEEYVESELRQTVPCGWSVVRDDPGRLWWRIKKILIHPGEWPDKDYSLVVSDDFQWLILTYGNCDVGPPRDNALQKAMVISASSLKYYGLSECIDFIFNRCEPNEWGYS